MLSNGVYTVGNNTLGSRRPLRDLDAKTGSSTAGENAIKKVKLCCEAKENPFENGLENQTFFLLLLCRINKEFTTTFSARRKS